MQTALCRPIEVLYDRRAYNPEESASFLQTANARLEDRMPINADKPHLWKKDIGASVDLFNDWFMRFAPKAYRDTRVQTTKRVEDTLRITKNLSSITADVLKRNPTILPTLRMATCPPLARDRLIGLAYVSKNVVNVMEKGRLPTRMQAMELDENLKRIADTLRRMLDKDIFPWLDGERPPTKEQRYRGATVVADRLCGAVSDPIIRNAQEKRQLAYMARYLRRNGYAKKSHPSSEPINRMQGGTFDFRVNIVAGEPRKVNIPVDVVIQPKRPTKSRIPILIEAKSAGDFTNVNKRRKEEAMKVHQLRATYGEDIQFILLLCGYFDSGYLGYEAAEGIDWVWEHRIGDMDQLGI